MKAPVQAPIKSLYLLRHAKSSWATPGQADKDRPLNARGQRACLLIADYIRREGLSMEWALVSTAQRTQETAARIQDALGQQWEGEDLDLLYHAEPDVIEEMISLVPDVINSVIVIGHNPGMAEYARHLAARGSPDKEAAARLADKYPTAGLARFTVYADQWSDLAGARADLLSFITPRLLSGEGDED